MATDMWEQLARQQEQNLARVRAWVHAGVVVTDPRRVQVAAAVTLAAGVTLGPDVSLRGTTTVAAGAHVGQGAVLTDTAVGAGATLLPYVVATNATIGPGAQVGPFAHLRKGAVLENDTKVGNFVEVKNTTLREGAKASHLTYLGDAEVGAGANVGAGTITCNYDGYGKHHTHIGSGAFIGSNTALVAPVSVGDGAIVGAGSVITQDVPDDALAVERSAQRVLADRAPRLRARNAKLAGKQP